MKRLHPLSTTLLIIGIALSPVLAQQGDEESKPRSGLSAAGYGTRFIGISNIYEANLTGLQVALATNMLTGDLTGLQVAGLANITEGRMGGVQVAGMANISGGAAVGAQLSMLANVAGEEAGLQLTGLANIAGGGAFLQGAGLANIAADEYTWGQFAGLVNVAAGGNAVQLSGLANVSAGGKALFQATGIANVAQGEVALQAAGVVNVAGESAWGQIGVFNITPQARLFQIGVINIAAKNSGLPLGILNVIDGNPLRYSIMVDGYGQATAALRSGNRHVYTVAGFQGGDDMSIERLGTMLLGVGLNLPLNRFYLSAEYLHNQRVNAWDQREGIVGLRAGFRVTWDVALVAGASVPWNDLTGGDAASALTQGWSIGLEWFRSLDFNMPRDLGFDFGDF